jgi:hypothetical protein
MKKLISFLVLLLISKSMIWCCSCIPPKSFCETIATRSKSSTTLVIKALVERKTDNEAQLQILTVLVGNESRSTIKCFRHDPLFCGTVDFGNEGDIAIFILNRIDSVSSFSPPTAKKNDYQLPLCQFIKLKIEGTKIRGFITQNKEQTIDESELLCNLFNTKSSTLNSVKTFPNPTNNYLYFKGLENEIDISITDLLGRNAYTTKVNPNKNAISLADLASGIYIVRMQYLSSVLLVKIVKF